MASSQLKSNRAAWQLKSGIPLEISEAPYPVPGPNQLVLRTRAVAINPANYIFQALGTLAMPQLKYPGIYGEDVAGEILEIGSAVTRFKTGDRVFGIALGLGKSSVDNAQGGFQEVVLMHDHVCTKIPDGVTFEEACVLPLAVCTAATGLYQQDLLALPLPKVDAPPTGKTLLIWGGSSSVGTVAVQFAFASGLEVFTTCSPRNFDLMKKLGASRVFDYNSPTVVADIAKAFDGKSCAGAFAIVPGAAERCIEVFALIKPERKFISMAYPPGPGHLPKGIVAILSFLLSKVAADLRVWWNTRANGLTTKFYWGGDMVENEVGTAIWTSFLEEGMAKGKFVPSPEPIIVPTKGLEGIQEGYGILEKGVSAKKVVVSGI